MKRREFLALFGAAAWPFAAGAQQPIKVRRIAIVHPSMTVKEMGATDWWAAFTSELSRLGHVEGVNLVVNGYSGEGVTDRLSELASLVVQSAPDIIVAMGVVIA